MKLELGMYVRTKNGSIDKITDITEEWYQREGDEDEKTYKIYKLNNTYYDDEYDEDTNWFFADFFVKTSHNLIDLIEVGDFVNGIKITEIKDGKPFVEDYNDPYYSFIFNEEDIKSLVTREQFEQMEYNLPNSK